MNVLNQIKHLIFRQQIIFTDKAINEIERDNLTQAMVLESIVYAPDIYI